MTTYFQLFAAFLMLKGKVKACIIYAEIRSLKIILRKQPVLNDSGPFRVMICMERAALDLFWHAKSI